MKTPEYQSSLGKQIETFVEQKRAVGHPYDEPSRILKDFDTMLTEAFPSANHISKEITDAWIERKKKYPRSLGHLVSAVRQLSKYLNGMGIPSYVIPRRIPSGREHFEPHIYTDSEKVAFFSAVDRCPWRKVSPYRCYIVPMIFRLIYCCGLRASEARLLKRSDMNLTTGEVVIRESKGWRRRIVYVSLDLLDNLKEYDATMENHLPGREPFFPNRQGAFYSSGVLDSWFHEFWDPLQKASTITGSSARVHDWRHTHLTDRLNLWVHEGRDVNALYVYLSEYAGHTSFAETDYYLHLVPGFYPEIEKRMAAANQYILPEVPHGR